MGNNEIEMFFQSSHWEVLKLKVIDAVKKRFEALIKEDPSITGLALIPGETYEVDYIFTASTNELIEDSEVSLCPDEWPDWHNELVEVTPLIGELNKKFKAIHKSDPNCYLLDEVESALIKQFQDTFLAAMIELKNEGGFIVGGKEVFTLIWLSDVGMEEIVIDSVEALNSDKFVKAFNLEMVE